MYTNHVKIGTVVSKHGYKGDIKISVSSNNLDSSLVINNVPIRVNTQNIISSIIIDSDKNASVVGPITVDSGVNIRVNGNFTVL